MENIEIVTKLISKTKTGEIKWVRQNSAFDKFPFYVCDFVDGDFMELYKTTSYDQNVLQRWGTFTTYRLVFKKNDGYIYQSISGRAGSELCSILSNLYSIVEETEFKFDDKIEKFLR